MPPFSCLRFLKFLKFLKVQVPIQCNSVKIDSQESRNMENLRNLENRPTCGRNAVLVPLWACKVNLPPYCFGKLAQRTVDPLLQ